MIYQQFIDFLSVVLGPYEPLTTVVYLPIETYDSVNNVVLVTGYTEGVVTASGLASINPLWFIPLIVYIATVFGTYKFFTWCLNYLVTGKSKIK